MINRKKFNLLDLDYILVDSINNDLYEKLFEKYEVRTFKDLDDLIKDGTIKDKFLEGIIEDRKAGIGIQLKDVSTECLKNDSVAKKLLEKLNINNFQELGIYIGNENEEVINNMYLINAFKMVAKLITEKNKSKTR